MRAREFEEGHGGKIDVRKYFFISEHKFWFKRIKEIEDDQKEHL